MTPTKNNPIDLAVFDVNGDDTMEAIGAYLS